MLGVRPLGAPLAGQDHQLEVGAERVAHALGGLPDRPQLVVGERAAGVGLVLQVLALQSGQRVLGDDLAVDGPVEEAREVLADIARRTGPAFGDETVEQRVHVAAADVGEGAVTPFGIDVQLERPLDLAPALDIGLGVLVDEALRDGLDRVRSAGEQGLVAHDARVRPSSDFCSTSIAASRACLTPRIGYCPSEIRRCVPLSGWPVVGLAPPSPLTL